MRLVKNEDSRFDDRETRLKELKEDIQPTRFFEIRCANPNCQSGFKNRRSIIGISETNRKHIIFCSKACLKSYYRDRALDALLT